MSGLSALTGLSGLSATAGGVSAPNVVSAVLTVAHAPILTITMSELVAGHTGFALQAAGTDPTLVFDSAVGNTLIFTMSANQVSYYQTPFTLSYTPGDVESDATELPLAAFSGRSVTNSLGNIWAGTQSVVDSNTLSLQFSYNGMGTTGLLVDYNGGVFEIKDSDDVVVADWSNFASFSDSGNGQGYLNLTGVTLLPGEDYTWSAAWGAFSLTGAIVGQSNGVVDKALTNEIPLTPTSVFGARCVGDYPKGPLYCRKADDSPCAAGDEIEKQYNRANDTWYTTTDGPILQQDGGGFWYASVSGTNKIAMNSLTLAGSDTVTMAFAGYQTNTAGSPVSLSVYDGNNGNARIPIPRDGNSPPKMGAICWGADGASTIELDTSTPKTLSWRFGTTNTCKVSDGTSSGTITLSGSLIGFTAQPIYLWCSQVNNYQFAGRDYGSAVITTSGGMMSDADELALRAILDTWRP